MRQLLHNLLMAASILLTLNACIDEDEFDDTPNGNFEALWKIINEHYCFFEYKQVDWNAIHDKYQRQLAGNVSDDQLFEVLGNMLAELRDGHVNLYSPFDVARYWTWYEAYPSNYSDSLITHYLGTHYRMASGMKYRILDDNTGYIRVASFANGIGAGNLDEIMLYLSSCQGLIIDVRDNGGGLLTSAEELAARFTNEEITVGYMQHKTGRGHNDFSSMEVQTLKPGRGLRWQKSVVVLTNRGVYSAANEFVKYMRCCPNTITVGDRTGGGAGLPFSSELPNGWIVRFSACPMYDAQGNSTEFGIDPDCNIQLTESDRLSDRDTIIEFARQLIRNKR